MEIPKCFNLYLTPTQKQGKAIIWERLLAIFPYELIERKVESELILVAKHTHARLQILGVDNKDALRGLKPNRLTIDECQDLPPNTYEKIIRPMVSTGGHLGTVLALGTKRPKNNWFRKKWLAARAGSLGESHMAFHHTCMDNPEIDPAEWEDVRRELFATPGGEKVWKDEFIGDPTIDDEDNEGLKYAEFNRKDHICEPFVISTEWPRFHFLDWGMDHPCAVLFAARRPEDGKIFIYDELEFRGKHAHFVGKEVVRRFPNESFKLTISDPQCWEQESDGQSIARRLRDAGLRNIRPGKKESKDGTYRGANAMKAMLLPEGGEPRVAIFPNCFKLIYELENLTWDDKKGDDYTDAARYGLEFLNSLPLDAFLSKEIEEIPDGSVIEDRFRINYMGGRIKNVEPLKTGGKRNAEFTDLGDPV